MLVKEELVGQALKNLEVDPSLKVQQSLKDKVLAAIPVAKALFFGQRIDRERKEARLRVCSTCDKVSLIDNEKPVCGICACHLLGSPLLIVLTDYEETSSYGCKHPIGSKWKKAGV